MRGAGCDDEEVMRELGAEEGRVANLLQGEEVECEGMGTRNNIAEFSLESAADVESGQAQTRGGEGRGRGRGREWVRDWGWRRARGVMRHEENR
jgi:hypothetical protein